MATVWGNVDSGAAWPPWVEGCPDTSPSAVRLVALAIADVVNDVHNNDFYASFGRLARKIGMHRNTVRKVVRHMTEQGALLELERGRPGSDEPGRYRWCWWPERSVHRVAQTARPVAQTARQGRAGPRDRTQENATDVRAGQRFMTGVGWIA